MNIGDDEWVDRGRIRFPFRRTDRSASRPNEEADCGSSETDCGSSGSSEIMRDLDTTHETADGSSTPPTPSAAVVQQETLPARCPFCGNVPIVPGQGVPDKEDRRPVGGVLEKGRYKVRAAPRKENRLAQW